DGLIQDAGDIENIVVKTHEGIPVFIRDVAEVAVGHETRRGAVVKDGVGEAVGGMVLMIKDGNARQIVRQVKEKVAEINTAGVLPGGVQIVPYYDRTFLVNKSIGTVEKALLEGILLVVVVVYLFLRNFRSSLVISLALPLAAFATFILMRLLGLSANLMSLGGLAISIGMIIDAAIIQVENVERHLAENNTGKSRLKVILDAILEVRKPSIFGELIIALTFLPILSLQGMEGKLFTPLAKTVVLALLSSLVLSIFVIPVLCFLFLRPHHRHKTTGLTEWIKKTYAGLLEFCLNRRKLVITGALTFLLLSLSTIPFLGTEFIPYMDEGDIVPQIFRLPSVSLEEAIEIDRRAQKRLMQFPEVQT
ncbi:MAG: efflux RND transporter permease subunit, partial [candidate division Zixibacteria bacterium]|nr:efflux RND transporter permease subunit [candidate division Zixibacteria bacterium]